MDDLNLNDFTVSFDCSRGNGYTATYTEKSEAAEIVEAAIRNQKPSSVLEAIEVGERALSSSMYGWMLEDYSIVLD